MKIWTLVTGTGEATVHLSAEDAERAAADFVAGCDDSREVDVGNWRDVLASLNADMEDAGEAGYLCAVAEHRLPAPRILVRDDAEQGLRSIETDSPLLAGCQAAVLTGGRLDPDYGEDDVFSVPGLPGEQFIGHVEEISLSAVDLGEVVEAIERKDAAFAARYRP